MRKQLPPRDMPWFDEQGRPTDIFYDYVKDLERRSLGQPVSITDAPVNGQFLVYSTVTANWGLAPATPQANTEVLIWNSASGIWVPGAN